MSDVFISYARKDNQDGFVTRLFEALERHQFDAWMDKQDIPPAVDFLKEIYPAIDAADTFLFIISPNSAASEYCLKELERALQLNKRLIPILRRETNSDRVHPKLRALNWIFATHDEDFETAGQMLMETLRAGDQDYLQMHTRLIRRALDWEKKGRTNSYLLTGAGIIEAENWLTGGVGKQPSPTTLHAEFIAASRRVANRRQRTLLAGAFVAVVVSLLLATVAAIQAQAARTAEAAADRERDDARRLLSLNIAASARELYTQGDPVTALALALEANRIENPPLLAQRALADVGYASGIWRDFSGLQGAVDAVVFSPDGKSILSGGCAEYDLDGICANVELVLWDIEHGREVRRFIGGDAVVGLAISPDGRTAVSTHREAGMKLWDIASGQEIPSRSGGGFHGNGQIAFSPDGQLIVSGSDMTLWDVNTGREILRFAGSDEPAVSVAFSPEGKSVVALAENGEAILADVASGSEIRRLLPTSGLVVSAAFTPTRDAVLTASENGSLILWDLMLGSEIQRFEGYEGTVTRVAFSDDGLTLVTGSDDGTLILWDTATGDPIYRFQSFNNSISALAFSPDGRFLLSGYVNGTLTLVATVPGGQIRRMGGSGDRLSNAVFSPDGKIIIATSWDHAANIWNSDSGQLLRRFEGQDWLTTSLAISHDGRTAVSGTSDSTLILWDLETGHLIDRFVGHNEYAWVTSVVFSPDDRYILSGSDDGEVILWDITDQRAIQRLNEHTYVGSLTVAFSPDGQMAASAGCGETDSEDNCIRGKVVVWEVAGDNRSYFEESAYAVRSVAFSPDGQTVSFGACRERYFWRQCAAADLVMWNMLDGSIRRFEEDIDQIDSVAFSPDGSLILSGGCKTRDSNGQCVVGETGLWDVASGQILRSFIGHTGEVNHVTFSPNDQAFLSVASDGSAILWRIDTLDELITWTLANRFVAELTCAQGITYGVAVSGCSAGGSTITISPFPTATIPVWTPIASPTLSDFRCR